MAMPSVILLFTYRFQLVVQFNKRIVNGNLRENKKKQSISDIAIIVTIFKSIHSTILHIDYLSWTTSISTKLIFTNSTFRLEI